jgi:hypothetical protein
MSGNKCSVIMVNYPRKNETCDRSVMEGKNYCYAHREEIAPCGAHIERSISVVHFTSCVICQSAMVRAICEVHPTDSEAKN